LENRQISIIGWFILLLLLYFVSKTTTGYKMIYYALILIGLVLFLGQSNTILGIIAPKKEN